MLVETVTCVHVCVCVRKLSQVAATLQVYGWVGREGGELYI